MIVDLADLRNMTDGVRESLDHRLLDDVDGLGPATLENLAAYIFGRVSLWPCFTSVKVWRADGGACLVESSQPESTSGRVPLATSKAGCQRPEQDQSARD
jgi:6-pyruvoyltetrahydropterin/6-carboxytetrahydropterin synthase